MTIRKQPFFYEESHTFSRMTRVPGDVLVIIPKGIFLKTDAHRRFPKSQTNLEHFHKEKKTGKCSVIISHVFENFNRVCRLVTTSLDRYDELFD